MSRETRIGLLVSLGFVVVFGLILSELTGLKGPAPAPASPQKTAPTYTHTYPVPKLRTEQPRLPAVVRHQTPPVRPQAGRPRVAERTPPPVSAEIRRTGMWRRYIVRPSDSLIGIARKVYGRGNEHLYRRILQANRTSIDDESVVQPGQVLMIPPLSATEATGRRAASAEAAPDPARRATVPRPVAAAITREDPRAVRTHVVRRGETLHGIAWKYYGDDSRRTVERLINTNKAQLEGLDHLPQGLELRIP